LIRKLKEKVQRFLLALFSFFVLLPLLVFGFIMDLLEHLKKEKKEKRKARLRFWY